MNHRLRSRSIALARARRGAPLGLAACVALFTASAASADLIREDDDGGSVASSDPAPEKDAPPKKPAPPTNPPPPTNPATPTNLAPPTNPAPPKAAPGSAPIEELKILRIAMQDLKVTGLDPRLASVVSDSLLVELRKMRGVSVIGMDEIRAMLDQEANKAALGCEEESSCLADIAGALGAEELLSGSIAVVGDEYVFGLRRINQAEAKVTGSLNRRLKKGDGEELLAAVGPAIAELFPELTLKKGAERGVGEEVALKLNPPPLRAWIFKSAAASSVVLATAAATFWASNIVVAAYYRVLVLPGLEKEGASLASVGPVQVTVNVFLTLAIVTTLATVLSAGAAALAFPLTDFEGYQDAVVIDDATEGAE